MGQKKKNEIDTPLPPLTHHHPQHQTRLQKRIHAILIKKKTIFNYIQIDTFLNIPSTS